MWLNLLNKAKNGVSINNIVYRAANVEAKMDVCEQGIGNFTSQGTYWR